MTDLGDFGLAVAGWSSHYSSHTARRSIVFLIQNLRKAFPTVTLVREIWRVDYEGVVYFGSVFWIGGPILRCECFCPWWWLPKVIAPGKMLPHGKASWEGSLPLNFGNQCLSPLPW